ncbi:hypothetical protein SDC9_191648 [bioreactor metagenome]|uniref:Uncharacterized protein n=1 Tax=bioreactor metagenome TaxID=1076179 RepID=A0A645HYJ4_9ZZZZ
MLTDHCVVQGAILQGNLGHLATCLFHRLLHGDRHFAGLALAHADATIAIADDGQGSEAHDPTALDDFGDAIDGDHLLAKTVITLVSLLNSFVLRFSHFQPLLVPGLRTADRFHGQHRPGP